MNPISNISKPYKRMEDSRLAALAQKGDELAASTLINRYKYIPYKKAKDYFL